MCQGVSPVSFGGDVGGVSPASRGADEARQGDEPRMDGAVGCGLPTAVQAVAKPAWALNGAKEGADRGESHSSSLGTALQPYLCT